MFDIHVVSTCVSCLAMEACAVYCASPACQKPAGKLPAQTTTRGY